MSYIDFSKLFHRASKDLTDSGRVYIPHDSAQWPSSWKTLHFKSYGKRPELYLPPPPKKVANITDLIEARASQNTFSKQPISLENLSYVLKYSCGETSGQSDAAYHRAQPSGGARYPIEAYLLILQDSPALPAGTYHYNVRNHSLDILEQKIFSKSDTDGLFTYSWVADASAVVLLTACFQRTKEKYGQRGYRFALLEAGHIGQNLYLTSQTAGVGCSALGGTRDEALEKLLSIDGISESLVYSIVLGI